MSTISSFAEALQPLTRARGVQGALLISARDGVIVDAVLPVGQAGDRVAALVASLYGRARRSAEVAGLGHAGFLMLETAEGRVCAIGGLELIVAAVTNETANIGMLRMELLRAAEALSR